MHKARQQAAFLSLAFGECLLVLLLPKLPIAGNLFLRSRVRQLLPATATIIAPMHKEYQSRPPHMIHSRGDL